MKKHNGVVRMLCVIAVVCSTFFISLQALAKTGSETIGKYTWKYEYRDGDDDCGVYDVTPRLSGAVDVPGRLGGLRITYMYDIDFSACTALTLGEGLSARVYIYPYSYAGEGSEVWINAPFLKSLSVPESLQSLSIGVRNLEKVVFPGDVSVGFDSLCWVDSIYYPTAYATTWKKFLRNSGYGGTKTEYRSSQADLMAAIVEEAPQYATDETSDFGPFVAGLASEQTMASAAGQAMSGVPAGMTWDKASGTLSGTAKTAGEYSVKVGGKTMTVRVDPNPGQEPGPGPEPEEAFEEAHTFNGLVYADEMMCGIVQVTTSKATAKGVKVGGFVMLADGKKQTIKSVTEDIEGGKLYVETKAGKLGDMELEITDNGFTGSVGLMMVQSGDVGEDTGIVSGTLKMSYFDAKTNKLKTRSIKLGGVASGDEAAGTLTTKGEDDKAFIAEIK